MIAGSSLGFGTPPSEPQSTFAQLGATLSVTACMVLSALPASQASAQPYPSRPVRLIAASSPGSGVDIVARVIGQKLSENIGQQVVIDNRAGAGGNLGAEIAAHAAPDGYTLFMATPAHVINASLQSKPTYDVVRDFAPVSLLTSGAYIAVVHPSVPIKTIKELIAYAKANPGKLNYASAGVGNATHLAGELFRILTGAQIVHVPYKGSGPAKTELLAGQVQLMFSNLTVVLPEVQSGKLRALAVTTPKRVPALPQMPTVAEAGVPGYEVTSWFAVLAPTGTRSEIVDRLNKEFTRAVQSADVRDRLASQGADPVGSSPQELARHLRAELARWSKVIKAAGIKPE